MSITLGTLDGYFAELDKRYSELTELISAPEILGDTRLWQKYSLERSALEKTVQTYRRFKEYERVYISYLKEIDDAEDAKLKATLKGDLPLIENILQSLRAELLLGTSAGGEEKQSVLLELVSSARDSGGFALDLLNAYKRFAVSVGLTFRIEREDRYPTGGVKEAIARVEGEGARNYLVNESGVHYAILSGGKSATLSIAVYGAPLTGDCIINESEISIDLFHASGAGGQNVNKVETAVRAKHIPTGIVVVCKDERSQLMNRNRAVGELKERVREYYKRLKEEVILEEKNKARAINRRIRAYDYTSETATDLRLNITVPFIGGEIELSETLRMLALTIGE